MEKIFEYIFERLVSSIFIMVMRNGIPSKEKQPWVNCVQGTTNAHFVLEAS